MCVGCCDFLKIIDKISCGFENLASMCVVFSSSASVCGIGVVVEISTRCVWFDVGRVLIRSTTID
jgi:hypothetical protein